VDLPVRVAVPDLPVRWLPGLRGKPEDSPKIAAVAVTTAGGSQPLPFGPLLNASASPAGAVLL
jgi:hypothetical protein